MQEQNLSFDQAFTEIIKREHEIKTATARKEEPKPLTVKESSVRSVEPEAEPWPKGKLLLM